MTGATAYKAALLESAARYVALGWQVFICGNDKKPLQQGGFKNASTDLSRSDRVLIRHPDGMLAVRTGSESGIVVIDPDVDAAKGIDGRDWLIEAQRKGMPDCPIAETPRGGLHLYFAHPGRKIQNSVGPSPGPRLLRWFQVDRRRWSSKPPSGLARNTWRRLRQRE